MKLEDAQALAIGLMRDYKLEQWEFGFNARKRGLGVCKYQSKRIELSRYFVTLNDESVIVDCIKHEIAHALTPHAGHGRMWKLQAVALGCKPEACRTADTTVLPEPSYRATCPNCGNVANKYGKPRSVRKIACADCCRRYSGNRYDDRFRMEYVKV